MTKKLTIIFIFLMTGCTCFSLPVDQSQLIYEKENEVPTGPVLATGMLAGTNFTDGMTQWYTVEFETPYEQQEGEKLSFTVQIGPSGDPYGWLESGQSINNPYPGGLKAF